MLFDMNLNDLATQATNKQFQYEFSNFKSKEAKNNSALSFIEKTKTGLTDFNGVLDGIRHNSGGVVKKKITVSQSGMADIKIKDHTAADSVNLFVSQLATAHEIALDNLDNIKIASETGVYHLKIGNKSLDIDFSKINTVDDLAKAINQHADNKDHITNDNLVSATVRRVNGQILLVLKSNNTGKDNEIKFDAPGLFTAKDITEARDAKVKLGGENSTVEVSNSSNTFDDLMKNVSITLTQAHKTGESPLTIKVEQDTQATEVQVKKFTDAFNAIKEVVKYDKDNPNPYTAGMHNKINRLSIEPINGRRLSDFGLTFDKSGQLKIDNKKLLAEIAKDPTAINDFFNSKDGLISKFDTLLEPYLVGGKWSLDIEKTKLDDEKAFLSVIADKLDGKYESALSVNLNKLNEMERVMKNMESMINMFDFEEKKNN